MKNEIMKNGFTQIPNALIRNIKKLGLNAYDFSIIVAIMSNKEDYLLTNAQISAETGISRNTVSKSIKKLIDMEYMKAYEVREEIKSKGKIYYLTGLFTALSAQIKADIAQDVCNNSQRSNLSAQIKADIAHDRTNIAHDRTNIAHDRTNTAQDVCTNKTKKNKNTTNTSDRLGDFSFSQDSRFKEYKITVNQQAETFINNLSDDDLDYIKLNDKAFLHFKNYEPSDKELTDLFNAGFYPENLESLADYWTQEYEEGKLDKAGGKLYTPKIALILSVQSRLESFTDFFDLNPQYEDVTFNPDFIEETKKLEEKRRLKKERELKDKKTSTADNVVSFEQFKEDVDTGNDLLNDDICEEELESFLANFM